jgi:hypothetical protein
MKWFAGVVAWAINRSLGGENTRSGAAEPKWDSHTFKQEPRRLRGQEFLPSLTALAGCQASRRAINSGGAFRTIPCPHRPLASGFFGCTRSNAMTRAPGTCMADRWED